MPGQAPGGSCRQVRHAFANGKNTRERLEGSDVSSKSNRLNRAGLGPCHDTGIGAHENYAFAEDLQKRSLIAGRAKTVPLSFSGLN
jgi:hypothetical protein